MDDDPEFFLPAASSSEEAERVYAEFAKWCHASVPDLGNRIYSIGFNHDGDSWVATVGESLRGTRTKTTRSKGTMREHTVQLSDPALVLAIFPGSPYFVVTNHNVAGNVGSRWVNPFMAGAPSYVRKFRAPQ